MSYQDPRARPSFGGLPTPGTVVGGYVIERQVGEGGMAVVFEARHRSLNKRVALKMLLPSYSSGTEIARRFAREGEAAARIDHPHAVDVTDVGTDARGNPFLVMEFLEGEDLANLLARCGRLTVAQTADILVPVVSAIATAHDLGIVHRDLKPQNIFLARRRQEIIPKVVDFGISKSLEESMRLTGTETLLGTPYYMSPEQSKGASQVDARSDQFALGVILYECVTGVRPFEGSTLFAVLAQIMHGSPPPPRALVPTLEPAIEAIIERALQKNPADRFPDVRALGAALTELSSTRVRLSFGPEFGFAGEFEPPHSTTRTIPDELSRTRFMADTRSSTGRPAELYVAPRDVPRRQRHSRTPYVITALLTAGVAAWFLNTYTPKSERTAAPSAPDQQATSNATRPPAPPTAPAEKPAPAPVPAPRSAAHPEPSAKAAPRAPEPPPTEFEVAISVDPPHAWITFDGKAAGSGTLSRRLPIDGVMHKLTVGAPGYRPVGIKFRDAPPPAQVVLTKLDTPRPAPEAAAPEAGAAAEGAPSRETSAPPTAPPEGGAPSEPSIAAPPATDPAPSDRPPQQFGTNGAPILR